MSDVSRIIYSCVKCYMLPCICKREHAPLVGILSFPCMVPYCHFVGETINQLHEHRLDKHYVPDYPVYRNGTSLAH